jgi:hypothetical protein
MSDTVKVVFEYSRFHQIDGPHVEALMAPGERERITREVVAERLDVLTDDEWLDLADAADSAPTHKDVAVLRVDALLFGPAKEATE